MTALSYFLAAVFVAGAAVLASTPEEEAAARKQLEDAVDLTRGKNEICPVHKVKMTAKDVPIQFGSVDDEIQEKYGFPFAEEVISGGCLVFDERRFPKTGKVFVCPGCVEARKRWFEEAKKRWKPRVPK